MKSVLLNDLQKQYVALRPEILDAVERVLDSGWYVLGEECARFEQEFAEYCGVRHCVGLANGTDALEMAMRGVGVTIGDEVITVANAGMYSTAAILSIGAMPVYADIVEASQTICPRSVESLITNATGAIVVTHLFGQLAEIEALRKLADKHQVALIEDCAQSHGAVLNGRKAGSWGDCSAFSFYPTKNLGALGDGGAIVSNAAGVSEKARQLRQYGWGRKYQVELKGGRNSRLDEIQAAILRVKLRHLDRMNGARCEVAALYAENISHAAISKPDCGGTDYVAHLYVIKADDRDGLQQHLKDNGIGSEVHYPALDYQQPILLECHRDTRLEKSEEMIKKILTLPCYPGIDREEVLHVSQVINEWQR